MFVRRYLVAILALLVALAWAGCRGGSNASTPATNASDQSANAAQAASGEGSPSPQPSQAAPAETKIVIPAGQEIRVRLVDSLGSARSRRGDTFAATLEEPLIADGKVVVPRGANVTGAVVSARPSGHLKTPAELAVTLTSIEVGGKDYPLTTSDRSWARRSHKKRNGAWIAGAGGAGALIGALVGGGKGAAIGAGIGAGGGTATAYATGKKDIVLPSETRVSFRLREPLTFSQPS